MQKSQVELVLDRLREQGDPGTMKMMNELAEARAQEYRIKNTNTTGDETRIVQGKIQGLEEFKLYLNLQQFS